MAIGIMYAQPPASAYVQDDFISSDLHFQPSDEYVEAIRLKDVHYDRIRRILVVFDDNAVITSFVNAVAPRPDRVTTEQVARIRRLMGR